MLSVVLAEVLLDLPAQGSVATFQPPLLVELVEELLEVLAEVGDSAKSNTPEDLVEALVRVELPLHSLEGAHPRTAFQGEVQLQDKAFPKAWTEKVSERLQEVVWLFLARVHLGLAALVVADPLQGVEPLD